jgi:hypothetical protein
MESNIAFIVSDWFILEKKIKTSISLMKFRLTAHFVELMAIRTESKFRIVQRNWEGIGCLQFIK